MFAFHPHQDRLVVPATDVIPLGDMNPREATLFPLVETALQLARDVGHIKDDLIVVLGLGVVGLLTSALLMNDGARVVGSEPRSWRRATARRFGITAVSPDELGATVQSQSGQRGAGVVIEASGNPAALAASLPLLAHEGTALVASWRAASLCRYRWAPTSTAGDSPSDPARYPLSRPISSRIGRSRDDGSATLLDELLVAALATHTFASTTPPRRSLPSIGAATGWSTPRCATDDSCSQSARPPKSAPGMSCRAPAGGPAAHP